MKINKILFLSFIVLFLLSCKKEKKNPLLGKWKVTEIFSPHPLGDTHIIVADYIKERGFFPGFFTDYIFYNDKDAGLVLAEPQSLNELTSFLYQDPNQSTSNLIGELKYNYAIEGNLIRFTSSEFPDRIYLFELNGNILKLSSYLLDINNTPVLNQLKEICTLQRQ